MMIDAAKLKELLERTDESPKIEFKLKYEFSGQNKSKNLDEFVKDLLALTNTAGRGSDDSAHLIIGAGDVLRADGTRDAEDVRPFNFKSEQFLQIVNARCAPPVRDLEYSVVEHAGNFYGVIEIPPSPFIHELTRNLDTPKGSWQQGSVLVRRGSKIGVASPGEIKLMEREKESWSGSVAASRTPLELLEEYLPDPNKKIAVRKLILGEAKKLHAALNDPDFLAKDGRPTAVLAERMDEYENLIADFLELFAVGCYDAEEWLDSVWAEALTVVADINENGHCPDMLLRLRRYPALLLFYAGGVAAVAGERYKTLAALFNKTKVRRWSALHDAATALPPATVVERYDKNHLREAKQNPMPLELHLQNYLRESLGSVVHTEDEFLDCFTRFEYLFALYSLKKGNGIISGSYMWESEIHRKYRQSYSRDLVPASNDINAEIERDGGANWLPFKSGLFSGTWDDFLNFKNKADAKISEQAKNYLMHRDY